MYYSKKKYLKELKSKKTIKEIADSSLSAFLFGGMVGLLGQGLLYLFQNALNFSKVDARILMLFCLMALSGILSMIGIYDKIGQIAKCGLAIPITGFANSMVSSAMEYKPEGFVLGVCANTLKLAGSVIVIGSITGFFVALIKYIVEVLM